MFPFLQILLEDLGFDERFISPLRERYLVPICSTLFPDYGGCHLDSHKAFIVSYRVGAGVDLDCHYDNAEVTLNISLNDSYEEGTLYFGQMRGTPTMDYTHVPASPCPGYGLLHRGQQMHGALPIVDGERHNFIIWMRSSIERNRLCPMCNQKPVLVETDGNGDGFSPPADVNVCTVN